MTTIPVVVASFIILTSPILVLANPLDGIPDVADAAEGLQLIGRDAFGPLQLDSLLDSVKQNAVHERLFTPPMRDETIIHAASLTENFGRIELRYLIAVKEGEKAVPAYFNLSKEQIIDHFSSLDVGAYLGNQQLNDLDREYEWEWASGKFGCKVTYSYWNAAAPYLSYTCTSRD